MKYKYELDERLIFEPFKVLYVLCKSRRPPNRNKAKHSAYITLNDSATNNGEPPGFFYTYNIVYISAAIIEQFMA